MEGVIIIAIIWIGIYAIIRTSQRYKERTMLIRNGINPMEYDKKKDEDFISRFWKEHNLKIGLLALNIGLALIIANFIIAFGEDKIYRLKDELYFGLVFFFGGIALVISFFLEHNMAKRKEEIKEVSKQIEELKDKEEK
ncbi:MAG: DUF6249 domain-containing protein [Hyphomicrobiales bacterium]